MTLQERLDAVSAEIDRMKADIQLQGRTQTDMELNQLEQGALLEKIDGKLEANTNE